MDLTLTFLGYEEVKVKVKEVAQNFIIRNRSFGAALAIR